MMGTSPAADLAMPADVASVFDECDARVRAVMLELRALIFATAARTPGAGAITETLKWGQPSYSVRGGTPIRLGGADGATRTVSLFVHCQTDLVECWRAQYGAVLNLIGNREVKLAVDAPLPREMLAHCIAMALTYHTRKSTQPGASAR